jgi:outer membrane protein
MRLTIPKITTMPFSKMKQKGVKSKLLSLPFILLPFATRAQTTTDSLLQQVTRQSAVDYAISHQPLVKQSLIDQEITETTIRSKLADWFPQIGFGYSYQHNFIIQTTIIGGNEVKLGVDNLSSAQFTASQNIFNRDLLLASRTRKDVRVRAQQMTSNTKIDIAAQVSKAFYDVLATKQQVRVTNQNIVRLERSLKDALAQYNAGIVDKTDYKRATISLNNVRASKKSLEELLKAKEETLKALMGYPVSERLNIVYDSLQMETEALLDTSQLPDYTNRIEYRLLSTERNLLAANLRYNRAAYLPSISANGAYNLNFQNTALGKLYNNTYLNSFAAISLSWPIFQGGKRKANVEAAEWELKRNELDIANLRNNVNAEFTQAMAQYRSSLINFLSLKENLVLAQEVYDVINLQYKAGIKAYFEVITAETDLRTAQINYYDALFGVLASKIDVQRALGQIIF